MLKSPKTNSEEEDDVLLDTTRLRKGTSTPHKKKTDGHKKAGTKTRKGTTPVPPGGEKQNQPAQTTGAEKSHNEYSNESEPINEQNQDQQSDDFWKHVIRDVAE